MVAKNRNTATVAAASAAMISLPRAVGASPAARWGHQAVYVKSQKAMYILGGEVSASGSQITNEVLILPLNSTSPSFSTGSSEGLPPHAFAAAALSSDESSLVLVGGMTSDCSSDGLAHTLDLSGDDGWTSTTPSKLSRRRGAQSAWVDNNSTNGEIMVVGGIADSYSCANSTSVYTASDILSLPLSTSALVSSRSLPSSLTGSTLAVSDFGLASDSSGKIYLAGGQSSSGDLVSLDTIGVWDSTNGWQSQSTTGDVPDGRLGASLVAHPSLDVLVLHGGLVANTTSGSYTSSHLLALLNTTSFVWSTPSDLQPDSSSAASYHSAVMTDEGVMISAFGLSATNTPRSDVTYLDLRDTSQGAWTWESSWNSNMLNAYSSDTSTSANGATAASSTGGVTAADAKTSSGTSSKKLASIIVPVLVVALLILPIIVYLVRRRMRVMKKRRMARHFSFSSQEESGAFTSPFDQYLAKRRSQAQWPFGGQDANEQGGGIVGGVTGSLGRMVSRISNRSSEDEHNNMEEGERQMVQAGQRVRVNADGQQPMNWEEIDFGLGKLDESKNHDSSHIASSGAPVRDDQDLTAGNTTAGGYSDDVLYAAAEAMTPNSHVFGDEHAVSQPANTLSSAYPAIEPTPAYTAVASDGDWNQLEQSLSSKPAFRSISPTAQLRSHAHLGSPSTPSSPNLPTTAAVQRTASLTRTVSQASTVPSIPPFEFERTESPGGTITLINPKGNSETKEPETLPFSNQPKRLSGTPHRSVSQPISRQLAGGLSRRGSAPSSSGSEDGQSPKLSGVSGGQTAPQKTRAVSASHAAPSRKASLSSNGSVKYPSASKRRTQLRVVNMAEADEED
ncbi:hypothetical protein B9479_001385 [Cryptococcus floricola]|uniref:Galactose oxidase n=1 Tax=Cryptococcus floricola TaxID=2591691 RepID=A0A5D3B240_9TREE|nr:hypothetical protein B9479_001385 [Cryptococcus floricola]